MTYQRPVTFVQDKCSSRFSRTPDSLAATFKDSRKHTSIVTFTEVAERNRQLRLRMECRLADWAIAQSRNGYLGECAITCEKAQWEILHWQAYKIGPDLGPGGPVVMVIALLRDKDTGATLLNSEAHLPASVEDEWARRSARSRAVAHRNAVAEMRKIHREWRREYHPNASIAAADWNLDLHKRIYRLWIKSAWPGMKITYKIPAQGSFGRRLIDWILTRGLKKVRLRVLPPTAASDHRRVRITATIRGRRRKT